MFYRLPEDDGLPPKHVAVAKTSIVIYFKSGNVGFKKETYFIKSVDISTRYFDSPDMSLRFPPTHLASPLHFPYIYYSLTGILKNHQFHRIHVMNLKGSQKTIL